MLSLLFTVAHDAPNTPRFFDDFVVRKTGKTVRDVAVASIAADIVEVLPSASMVRGLAPRTLIDYNRPPGEAFEDPRLQPHYDYYHESIEKCLLSETLLVDLHGFASGENGGRKFDLLLSSSTPNIGRALSDQLAQLGYKVSYDDGSSGEETSIMTAGYTTQHYSAKGFHTLQIEISDKFRTKETRELGKKLSRDLAQVFRTYCLLKPEIACRISSGTVKTTVFD